jgi:hypothetical protein
LRPAADAEDLPALADIAEDAFDEDFDGFVEPDPAFDLGDAAGFLAFADDDEAFEEEDALADVPPADERVDFFLVVAMSVSVAGSVDERWGWNR